MPTPADMPSWLLVARSQLGQQEILGAQDNPQIVAYHATTLPGKQHDEIPWCSSFVNWCLKQCGLKGTGSAAALSWRTWGRPLIIPALGCIGVIDWGNGKGHVGFVVGRTADGSLALLGGNQGNMVKISAFRSSRFCTHRFPGGFALSQAPLPVVTLGPVVDDVNSTR